MIGWMRRVDEESAAAAVVEQVMPDDTTMRGYRASGGKALSIKANAPPIDPGQ